MMHRKLCRALWLYVIGRVVGEREHYTALGCSLIYQPTLGFHLDSGSRTSSLSAPFIFHPFPSSHLRGVFLPLFMEAPNLMVVPPTPLYTQHTPSLSSSVSTAPSTPGPIHSPEDTQRGSSETTMEIYSMYDDRSSWPNDGPIQDMSRATESPYRSIGHSSRTSSAYYTATAKSQRSSYSVAAPRISAVSTASRSSSAGTSSPYVGIEEDISSDYHNVLPPKPLPKPPQMYSRSGSSHANSDGANEPEAASQSRYLSPSPPQSRPSSARSHTSSRLNGHTTAPQRLSHGPPSEHASLTSPSSHLSRPASQTTGTSTSPRLLSKKRSDLSITPSAGEDPDSFHVRSTYAQLDILGVKGDGIDEGVERTRARVGGSRESELQAMNAVGDEDEKRRDLSPQEVQMLASLDR
jgi:USP6 N-terminal-like protein